ncbi:MAG TPA: M14 family metallopeptidase [Candidatus Paceibacterota bacterium]
MNTKNTIIALIVIIIVGLGIYFSFRPSPNNSEVTDSQATTTPMAELSEIDKTKTVIGKSVEGRDIVAYHYGVGTTTRLLFVGGIHGGYEWNTALVSYELMDYLEKASSTIPANVRVTVIPVLNPDGLAKIVSPTTASFLPPDISPDSALLESARFNGRNVDLNRNFDCDWQESAKWQNKSVSGGTAVFSEPESRAIKQYIENNTPAAVVVYYSAAGGVYSSSCHNGVSPETSAITGVYANASKYPAYKNFDFYAITGDMTNWLAKSGIPAISVLLTNHTDTELAKNQAGLKALLNYYKR